LGGQHEKGLLDMMSPFPRSSEIRAANPVLGANRLKLGVFGSNWVGLSMTDMPGRLDPTWDATLEIGRLADEAGFEAIVPISRWKSLVADNPQHPTSRCLENFTWASAMAACTRRAAVFVTCHIAVYHPVLAAKQAATVDQIARGRFGINIVAGWNARELGMFGVELLHDHEQRYGQAAEWMDIVRRVWESDEEFDYEGEFYDIRGAFHEPKPAQAPGPVIMNAGSSAEGRDFSARFSDMALVSIKNDDPQTTAQTVESYRAFAREAHGREVGVWAPAHIVHGDTDAHAQELADEMNEHGDYELVKTYLKDHVATNSTHGMPDELTRRMILGQGSFPLIGSAETIADRLEMLSEAGVDGLLLTWFDYADGIRRFAAEVQPLLEQRALRQPDLARRPDAGLASTRG
jgi:alkanesulfonate monooxygenase SsuD/methylene tetrahydromethanopterin reductase-like flavin-dependent oxidoreductase (luciferase family)